MTKLINTTYIIEHLEPSLWEWCLIEYEHISKMVGKKNLWFTNIKNKKDRIKLEKFGKVFSQSVKELELEGVCVLDPEAPKTLEPLEAKSYYYFVFGGILGDYPPKKRTKEELTRFISNPNARNIGKEQMSTDNAIFCVKQIVNGKKFSELRFQNNLNIKINEFESIDLPYCYNVVNNKPLVSPKLVKYLKTKKGF